MNNLKPKSSSSNEQFTDALHESFNPPPYITGGCLCSKVRYKAEIGENYAWPPGPHTCSCTHCRKHTGAPFALFLTLTCPQLGWPSPETGVLSESKTTDTKLQTPSITAGETVHDGHDISAWKPGDLPVTEYSHTHGRYRGFCGTCGSTMYWRCPNEDGDEIEMGVGTVDEELLEKYGKALCEPTRGRFYATREIHGVGFGGEYTAGLGGHRFKEGSRSEKIE